MYVEEWGGGGSGDNGHGVGVACALSIVEWGLMGYLLYDDDI